MNGLSSTRISVWVELSSSTFFRLPNRVFRLITRLSRRLSIGGLVTWLKFCRKKWLSGRYCSLRIAAGVSSPIEAIISLPSSTIGARTVSISSMVNPAAICRVRRSSPRNSGSSGTSRISTLRSVTFSTQSPNGCDPASRSLISVSWYSFPAFISTAIICPGPSAPFSRMLDSATGTIPVSDPAISIPSAVTT